MARRPERQRSHVFVVRDGLILVLQQSASERWWELPGGEAEAGEDSAAAAVREVFEETGFQLVRPELLRVWSYPSRSTGADVACYAYVAEAPAGDLRLSSEHSAYSWMTVDDYVEAYCSERLGETLPQFRVFFGELRHNCDLFRAWIRGQPRPTA